jgi:hypothetical protein
VKRLPRIAVSNTLTNVSDYLKDQGLDVVQMSQSVPQGQFDAIVLSGENETMMGMMDIQQECPVINAEGMTAEEVYQELKSRVPLQ